jgi:hypothetical protein
MRRRCLVFAAFLALVASPAAHAQFDHGHAAWNTLLKKHVRWLPDNKQSRVDYDGLRAERAALKQVLDAYSAVPAAEYEGWTRPQQMAFLINAYNAYTIELVLQQYPDLKSIKDLGSLISSPWRKKFFVLLNEQHHLDWIEHDQLRGRHPDWRVHAAVNCASIGCPALRNEAYIPAQLDAQLDDGMLRFMSDRTRNRARDGRLQVSPVFKWFREDFEKGDRGVWRVEDLFARYAAQLTDDPTEQAKVRAKTMSITWLDYDWSLNALGR